MNDSNPATRVAVILLAAGRSRRMGDGDNRADKLLLPLPAPGGGEEPLLRRSARLYRELGLPVTVVLRGTDPAHEAALAGLEVAIVHNPGAPSSGPGDGQQASVRAGLAAADLSGDGVLIALADQPLLTPADIRALISHFAGHGCRRIAIPRHAGARGNPVLLASTVARTLRDDPAAPGPRAWIDRHPDDIAWFEAGNDHFTVDIDTPDDAARLLARAQTLP